MYRIATIIFISVYSICTYADDDIDFSSWFEDATLRIDYVFGGDSAHQYIQMEQLYRKPIWAGRHTRLTDMPLLGNGQIHVTDAASGRLIFVHTFSTLFQEWQNELEATQMLRSFEASYNIPFPKKPIIVTVTLTDNHNRITSKMSHCVDPSDILIRPVSSGNIPYKYIVHSGNVSDCVDIAIVAEGYTSTEIQKFYADCERAADALFSHEPFKTLKSRFNVVAVASESAQSGPSEPGKGIWHNTVLSSHFDTFYSDRYLTTSKMHTLFDLLNGTPFEHIIILVNTNRYGGGGIYNQWMCSSSDHPTFRQVLVHEFGHSYAGLADEYAYGDSHTEWYPADTEPWEPNITTLKDFSSKWKDMMAPDTPIPTTTNKEGVQSSRPSNTEKAVTTDTTNMVVGVYEGAGYQMKGAYRPALNCRMRVNEVKDFCPVCTRAIVRITDFYTGK